MSLLPAIAGVLIATISSIRLPEISKWMDRKPFNCRPCSTFHLTWMQTSLLAYVFESWELFFSGIVTAFVIFFIIKYIDNKKVIK